jgi:predicted dithiol-disulfide oxidoreductase (DUF899 family)
VTFLEEQQSGVVEHDFRAMDTHSELHTYSAYIRGLDGLWGICTRLDRTPRGRNEDAGQEMGDLHAAVWMRRHDEYDSA